ncbi:MAG: hypothetical protein EKK64_10275 [Neisseriaceae bacterium]|nr:MAG: hypothetical protein EKK64_10275 [Neisseriaceae bacterium]
MAASSVTGKGEGEAGLKETTISKVNNVLFATPDNDGETIGSNISVVFLNLNIADFTLYLPAAHESVGKTILFRSRNGGYTATLEGIYGSGYNFNSSYVHFLALCDGTDWTIASWYNDD